MTMKKNTLCFVATLLIYIISSIPLSAQVLGQWREHYSFQDVTSIARTPTYAYASAPAGIYRFNPVDYSIKTYTKINGLHDRNMGKIHYHAPTNELIITYQNGNIDILNVETEQIINVPYIKNATSIIGARTINQIYSKDNLIYFSCSFGIVVYDRSRKEIKDR